MRQIFVFSLMIIACMADSKTKTKVKLKEPKYIEIEDAPYQVALIILEDIFGCTGTLVSLIHVIAPASCISEGYVSVAIVGSADVQKVNDKRYRVKEYKTHPKFDPDTGELDIGVVTLAKPVKTEKTVKPIPIIEDEPEEGAIVKVTSWGFLHPDDFSTELMEIEARVITTKSCRESYGNIRTIPNAIFCATSEQENLCPGESGGSAIYDGKLAGIAMESEFCLDMNSPQTFMSLAAPNIKKFLDRNIRL